MQYYVNTDFFILLAKIDILYVLFIIGWCKLLLKKLLQHLSSVTVMQPM